MPISDSIVTDMTTAGGLRIACAGIMVHDVEWMAVANLLPAIFVAPALVAASKVVLG